MAKLKHMFKKTAALFGDREKNMNEKEPSVPEGLWLKCPKCCLLYTSPSPRDSILSRMPSSA